MTNLTKTNNGIVQTTNSVFKGLESVAVVGTILKDLDAGTTTVDVEIGKMIQADHEVVLETLRSVMTELTKLLQDPSLSAEQFKTRSELYEKTMVQLKEIEAEQAAQLLEVQRMKHKQTLTTKRLIWDILTGGIAELPNLVFHYF